MTQKDRILRALRRGDKITSLGALRRFDCLRLSGRILELRRAGYPIETKHIKRNGKRFEQYSLTVLP